MNCNEINWMKLKWREITDMKQNEIVTKSIWNETEWMQFKLQMMDRIWIERKGDIRVILYYLLNVLNFGLIPIFWDKTSKILECLKNDCPRNCFWRVSTGLFRSISLLLQIYASISLYNIYIVKFIHLRYSISKIHLLPFLRINFEPFQ